MVVGVGRITGVVLLLEHLEYPRLECRVRALAASRRRDREFEHRRALDRGACLVAHGRRARGEGAVLEVHRALAFAAEDRDRRGVGFVLFAADAPVGVGERGGRHARRRRVVLVARGHRADPEAFGEEGRVGAAGVVEGVHRDAPGPNPGRGVAVALPLGRAMRSPEERRSVVVWEGDGWGGAKGDGEGEGDIFDVRFGGGAVCVAVVAARWARSGVGRRTVRRGLDRARAGRASRRRSRVSRASVSATPRRDAERRRGEGARARRAEDPVAAAGTRGSARNVYGRIIRARASGECARAGRRKRLRNVAPPTPGERYSGQPLTGAGRSGRPADRSWIDRRFDRRYPLNARPLATVVSPSNDRATRSNPREKLPGHRVDPPGAVPATRRIRRFASRTDVARGFIPPAGTPPRKTKIARPRAHAHQSPWLFVSSRARRRP